MPCVYYVARFNDGRALFDIFATAANVGPHGHSTIHRNNVLDSLTSLLHKHAAHSRGNRCAGKDANTLSGFKADARGATGSNAIDNRQS